MGRNCPFPGSAGRCRRKRRKGGRASGRAGERASHRSSLERSQRRGRTGGFGLRGRGRHRKARQDVTCVRLVRPSSRAQVVESRERKSFLALALSARRQAMRVHGARGSQRVRVRSHRRSNELPPPLLRPSIRPLLSSRSQSCRGRPQGRACVCQSPGPFAAAMASPSAASAATKAEGVVSSRDRSGGATSTGGLSRRRPSRGSRCLGGRGGKCSRSRASLRRPRPRRRQRVSQ